MKLVHSLNLLKRKKNYNGLPICFGINEFAIMTGNYFDMISEFCCSHRKNVWSKLNVIFSLIFIGTNSPLWSPSITCRILYPCTMNKVVDNSTIVETTSISLGQLKTVVGHQHEHLTISIDNFDSRRTTTKVVDWNNHFEFTKQLKNGHKVLYLLIMLFLVYSKLKQNKCSTKNSGLKKLKHIYIVTLFFS